MVKILPEPCLSCRYCRKLWNQGLFCRHQSVVTAIAQHVAMYRMDLIKMSAGFFYYYGSEWLDSILLSAMLGLC